MHILTESPCEQFSAIQLKLVFRGLFRIKQHTPKQAFPITPCILLKIFNVLDLNNPVQATFWCLALIAFFTMSRKSNLVPNTTATFDHKKQLCRHDIRATHEHLLIRMKWSKTNQFGGRILYMPLAVMPESKLCPVRAYWNMISLIPAETNGPAFLIPKGKKLIPFTYILLQKTLRKSIQNVGLDPSAYSSHSFRRGGATSAFRAHVPAELIQLQGDWASDAYKKYLNFNMQDRILVFDRLRNYIQQVESGL